MAARINKTTEVRIYIHLVCGYRFANAKFALKYTTALQSCVILRAYHQLINMTAKTIVFFYVRQGDTISPKLLPPCTDGEFRKLDLEKSGLQISEELDSPEICGRRNLV